MSKYQVLTESEAMESFDELLNDCHAEYTMGYLSFSPADILKTMDPVAYRCDFVDYVNSMAEDGVFYVEGYTDEDLEDLEETEEE